MFSTLHSVEPVPYRQSGFGLIEVLVSIVIVSIGLLGLAGLQTRALQENNAAYLRSQAGILVYDMFERLRSNSQGAASDNYNTATTSTTDDTLAATDLLDWKSEISRTLPNGAGVVSCTTDSTVATTTCNVSISWDDVSVISDNSGDDDDKDDGRTLTINMVAVL
ncbi:MULTISPECIES: type IV pilus modification protein PilV [unclassified Oceanobacter]|uniref:type IV pilus modification protein PilV n=2 Tax=Gammaproteobacteria TaxID=1236 RepID=UPI0026E17BB9|nr:MULTISPECIES: type IV pilus modification protein PilV [unclassified Oceanobacter]MDO6683725.1 type IV pilus modification protein PilV [Oceanobacter sp. 5_MG-2023]MDP2506241.1 type IV pilus modification protein PilV [Oceanobacter sp. 3_MG-2023]MDP2546497.1 type IV pilus modification protein PilV [Oceanobacter sp. 4_MG-2023]MDP2609827.1 type IV pilus modification protein PilV [Oceanobacter sp. 1_MG-2023]MDP2613157.1 type IV pilus modification protein PilV [Oceanobacter sp. 2_MG-2023]